MKCSEQDRLLREILEDGEAASFRAVSLARGVAFLACTSPFITYGLQVYPEMAAGAGLVWANGESKNTSSVVKKAPKPSSTLVA